jgi:hypothetical protein
MSARDPKKHYFRPLTAVASPEQRKTILRLIRSNYMSMYFNPVGRYLKAGETRPGRLTIQTGRGYMRIFLTPYVHDPIYSSATLEEYVRNNLHLDSFEFYEDRMLRVRYK